jgi:hypothetical protein
VCALLVTITLAWGIHQHSATHCCLFCHSGQLTWTQSAGMPDIHPPADGTWQLPFEPAAPAIDNSSLPSSSRAPPTC